MEIRHACAAPLALALALTAAHGSAHAQPERVEPPADAAAEGAAPAADDACCTVPARTVVQIEIVDALNSRANRSRDLFAIRLAEPLMVGSHVVAPAGTPGTGEIVHAARARAGGKAGELILAARYLDVNGVRLPLRTFRYGRAQGLDNSGAVNTGNLVAAAVLPVAAVLGYLVAGGEVDIPPGTHAHAMISADTVLLPVE